MSILNTTVATAPSMRISARSLIRLFISRDSIIQFLVSGWCGMQLANFYIFISLVMVIEMASIFSLISWNMVVTDTSFLLRTMKLTIVN